MKLKIVIDCLELDTRDIQKYVLRKLTEVLQSNAKIQDFTIRTECIHELHELLDTGELL
jgi:hypothetical protein